MFTRRQFVSGIALSTLALLLKPRLQLWERGRALVGLSSAAAWGPLHPRELAASDFRAQVGDTFRLGPTTGAQLKAQLREVVERPRTRVEDGRSLEQFSLIFESRVEDRPEQGTFVLSHPRHGECELFMVPVDLSGKVCCYEASFSRLV
jgi:hypothetical protein